MNITAKILLARLFSAVLILLFAFCANTVFADQIAFSVQNNVQVMAHISNGSADLNGTDVDWEIEIVVLKQGLGPGVGGEILFELDDALSSVFSGVAAVDVGGNPVAFNHTPTTVTADVGLVASGTIITLSGTSPQSDGQLKLEADFNNQQHPQFGSAFWPAGGLGVSIFPFPALPYSTFNTDESGVFTTESASAVGGYSAFEPYEEVLRNRIPYDYAMPAQAWPSELAEGMQLPSLMVARKMVPGNQETVSNSSPGMYFCFDYRLTWYASDGESAVSAILFDPVTEQNLYFDNSNVDGDDTRLYHKIQIGSEDVVSHNYFMTMVHNGGMLPLVDIGGGGVGSEPGDGTGNGVRTHTGGGGGGPIGEAGGVFDPDSGDGEVCGPEITLPGVEHVTLYRRNGWKYVFELVDTGAGSDAKEGRILYVTNPANEAISFTYQYDQSDVDDTGLSVESSELMKIATITDPYSMVATATYLDDEGGPMPLGRHVISKIEIGEDNAGTVTPLFHLEYDYSSAPGSDAEGHLIEVRRKAEGDTNSIAIANYLYDMTVVNNQVSIDCTHSSGLVTERKKLLLNPNYRAVSNQLVNEYANVLLGCVDGEGDQYLFIDQNQTDPELYDITYRDRVITWSPGQYWQYSNESFFARHEFTPADAEREIMMAQPKTAYSETGMQIDLEYDARSNVTSKSYIANSAVESTEEFHYEVNNLTVLHKDRDDYVTRTWRHDCGKTDSIVTGLVLLSPPDNDDMGVPLTDDPSDDRWSPIDQRYGYHQGRLLWTGRAAYTADGLNPANYGATFRYTANQRLETITDPPPPSNVVDLDPPVTEFIWTGDQLTTVSNKLEQVTDYLYDSPGRLVHTTFDDGTTESFHYDLANNVVETKNRVGVVSRREYDLASRMTQSIPAYATTTDNTGWYNTAGHTLLSQSSSDFDRSTYRYRLGQVQVHRLHKSGGSKHYVYDYRGRLSVEMSIAGNRQYIRNVFTYLDNQLFTQEYHVGAQHGDLSGDGVLSLLDIGPFISAVTSQESDLYPDAHNIVDMNFDGVLNLLDISLFIDAIDDFDDYLNNNGFTAEQIGSVQQQTVLRRTYFAFAPDTEKEQVTIRTAHNGVTNWSTISDVLTETRLPGDPENPDYIIEEVFLDGRGNVVERIDGRDTREVMEVSGLGENLLVTQDYGDPSHANLETRYTYGDFGQLEEMESPTGMITAQGSTALDSGSSGGGGTVNFGSEFAVFSETIAKDTPESLTTGFDFDPLGRLIQKRDPLPLDGLPDGDLQNPDRATDVFYLDICCERFMATRTPIRESEPGEDPIVFGDATLEYRDGIGRLVRKLTVGEYGDTEGTRPDNKAAEISSRYRPDGLMEFDTLWRVEGPLPATETFIGDATPPIAGMDGVPAVSGVTRHYMYDFDLTDNVGLSASSGITMTSLWSGTANISIAPAISKLAEDVSTGGAGLSFSSKAPGRAVAIVSPDEEVVQITIFDGIGRTVMNALIGGPAAPEPSDAERLIDWNCAVYDSATDFNSQTVEETVVAYFVTAETNSGARTRKQLSNGFRRAVALFDEGNHQNVGEYDAQGNIRRVTNALSQELTFDYDDLGRLTSTTDEVLAIATSFGYDDKGRLSTWTDGKGKTTHYEDFDGLDRATTIRNRLNHTTTLAYEIKGGNDFENTVIDATLKTTTYTLDKLRRRKSIELADGQTIEYFYDPMSRVIAVQLESGAKRLYDYAYSGVREKTEFFDEDGNHSSTDEFVYNNSLQQIEANQYDGPVNPANLEHKLIRDFTLRGLLAFEQTEFDGHQFNVGYRYDSLGRVENVKYPSGRNTKYDYTLRNQLEHIHWGDLGSEDEIEHRVYNQIRQLTDVNRPSGVNETRGYDGLRLSSIGYTGLGTVSYSYDKNHNKLIEEWTTGDTLHSWNFYTTSNNAPTTDAADGYDAEDRFTRFRRPNLAGGSQTLDLFRDAPAGSTGSIGNVSSINVSGNPGNNNVLLGDRDYNLIHGLDSIDLTGANYIQTFDVDGNLITSHTGTTLDWENGSRRLVSAIVPAGSSVGIVGTHDYGYEATGRRAWKKIAGSSEKILYIYAGPNCIAEYTIFGTGPTPPATLRQEHVLALRIDSPVLFSRNNDTERYNILCSQQWTVIALADEATGTIVETSAYDAFGGRVVIPVGQPLTFSNPFGFTGRRHDDETGWIYFRNRYLDCQTGEFLSTDPMEYIDGWTMYRFYPGLTGVDPWGLGDPPGFWEGYWRFMAPWGKPYPKDPWILNRGPEICFAVSGTCLVGAGGIVASGVSTKVAIHGAHHTFGSAGKLKHVQLNWWRAGVKGSDGVFRIPLPLR